LPMAILYDQNKPVNNFVSGAFWGEPLGSVFSVTECNGWLHLGQNLYIGRILSNPHFGHFIVLIFYDY